MSEHKSAPLKIIEAEKLALDFDGQVLLQPTSFALNRGEILAVQGANGTGKTTLLRLLADQISPSGGSLLINGSEAKNSDPEFRKKLAALLGLPPMARNLTLLEHLKLVASSWGYSISEAEQKAEQLMKRFKIWQLSARFPHELSSGQTQLFALVLTLIRPFEILLLDEPEQRLDSERLKLVEQTLLELKQNSVTIVLASHNQKLVKAVADQTVTLSEVS